MAAQMRKSTLSKETMMGWWDMTFMMRKKVYALVDVAREIVEEECTYTDGTKRKEPIQKALYIIREIGTTKYKVLTDAEYGDVPILVL